MHTYTAQTGQIPSQIHGSAITALVRMSDSDSGSSNTGEAGAGSPYGRSERASQAGA